MRDLRAIRKDCHEIIENCRNWPGSYVGFAKNVLKMADELGKDSLECPRRRSCGKCQVMSESYHFIQAENSLLRAEIKVYLLRAAKTVLDGLDDGITTVPNSLVHGYLKRAVPRMQKLLSDLTKEKEK